MTLTTVSPSEANLHRELLKQYDWCRRKFPNTCNEPALDPKPAPEGSSAPNPASTQNSWINDGIPRWDDGTPLDPSKYPEVYDQARSWAAGELGVLPINPLLPRLGPGPVPIRVPLRPIFVP